MRYLIYCDESDDKGSFYSNFYGGALLKLSDQAAIEARLSATPQCGQCGGLPSDHMMLSRAANAACSSRKYVSLRTLAMTDCLVCVTKIGYKSVRVNPKGYRWR
ncbi:MAG: hypothetical protein WDM89_00935 [Rhizomicrobium sp.]